MSTLPQRTEASRALAHGSAFNGADEYRTGVEWMVDALDCDESALRDLDRIRQICERVITDLGLNVVGSPQAHRFPGPGGVTALYMLSESHLACHTYPELRMATFNLYCCRQRPAWPWSAELATGLGSGEVVVRQFARGQIDRGQIDRGRQETGGQHPIDFVSGEANG